MRVGFGVFGVFFAVIAGIVLLTFIASGFLAYKCYASGNPDNIACFMISNRHEIGIRNR